MERRAVEVLIPAISKKYDVLLPGVMKIGTAANLIATLASEHEQININAENLLLGMIDSKSLLEDNITVAEANIADGATLILV